MSLFFKPKYFDPARHADATIDAAGKPIVRSKTTAAYVYSPDIILAINVALATQRPLLVTGTPGSGKTTLAANVAHVLGWKFYQRVITSRTKARDLMWTYDALRRLADAQPGEGLRPRASYIEPQVLWWAFDPASAARRGMAGNNRDVPRAIDPAHAARKPNAVVLLDEIDKAEPDVPNDLLEALDAERFTVDELDPPMPVNAIRDRVLMFITTNGERELPAAFLRRCVVLSLESPSPEWLVTIANDRYGKENQPTHKAIAQRLMQLRETARAQNLREPSTAEYLDALAACNKLKIDAASQQWLLLEQSVLWKRDEPKPPSVASVDPPPSP